MLARHTIRLAVAAAMLTACPTFALTTKTPTKHPLRREYVRKTFGPEGIARVTAGAALRRGKGSFGQHLATSMEGHVVKNTVEYGVASVRHEDLHYYRSTHKRFGPRLRHALVSTVVARKTTTGKRTVASGRMSGAAVAGLVAGGVATGGIAIAADAGANVAREFWPRKRNRTPRLARR